MDDLIQKEEKLPAIKLTIFQYLIVAVMVVLIFGLWRLQIVDAQNYRSQAEANRIRKVPILAPRGQIFDRDGRLMVDSYPSVSCFLVREQGHDYEADLPLIARGLHMTVDQIHAILKKFRAAPRYQPLPLKQDITPDEQEFIEAHRDEMPELETVDEQRRLYPKDGFAAHLVGYVGEVSEEMLNDPRYAAYEPGDVVGKSGVEESYDAILRGQDGSHDVLVDSHGREVGKLGTEPSKPGQSLKLTIDLDIQRAAENAFGDRNGAVIAMDPHTGEILAMLSRPTFDPNAFAVRIGRDEWNRLITDPNHPLLNKTIQAQLAPGSTFKVIMSLAGLQQNVAQDLKVNCGGGVTFYGHYFACDKKHGPLNVQQAISKSCDTYFYTLAVKLGIGAISRYAHMVGLGQRTGVDLPDEVSGVVPSEEWKMKTFHEKWYAGETVSVGIGQGALAVTPIQLARALSGIASGGVFKRPHIVFPDELPEDYRKAMLDTYPGSGDVTFPIDPDNWETITEGMAGATDPRAGGTAFASHLENIDFAGKTGTAQVISKSAGTNKVSSVIAERPNAWFVGMSPRRNPDIVVAVLWEHGGWGAGSAHVAARVIEAFVNKQRRLNHNLATEKQEPVEVGAVWSDPSNPDALGGRPVVAKASAHSPELDAMRARHFFIDAPPAAKQTDALSAAVR
ncbi:MAG: penicillin-binding protein 2 [Acidobacteriaceae bacterium]|nr:penicillin-binding protein 2 [Acidobacteriaceae bacterium]